MTRPSSNTARTRHAWLVPWVRICHLEIGKLVCQAESEQIFAKRNSRPGYHTVSVFSILWCLVRHRTHSHERQDWHLHLVKPNPFQRTKRANWVRTPASPFPVGSLQGEADSRESHDRTPIGVLFSFFWRLARHRTQHEHATRGSCHGFAFATWRSASLFARRKVSEYSQSEIPVQDTTRYPFFLFYGVSSVIEPTRTNDKIGICTL